MVMILKSGLPFKIRTILKINLDVWTIFLER